MKISGALTGVLVAIGIALGFLAGKVAGGGSGKHKSGFGGGSAESSAAESKSDRASLGSGRAGGRDSKSGRSAASTIRQVARELEFSPMAQMEFDVMFDTYEAIRWMKPADIQIALQELDTMGSGSQGNMMLSMLLINLWAKQDGRGAVEFSLNSKNQMIKPMAMMGGLMGWVKSDPEGAWTWFEENKDQVKKNGGMMSGQIAGLLFAALAQRDLPGTFARLGELNRREQKSALSMIGMQTIMDTDRRNQFVAQLDKLEDRKLREESLQSMVAMWAYQDPKAAVSFLESREWEEDTRNQLRQMVASSWANVDAEAAMSWRLDNLGENEDKASAVAGTFSSWLTRDAESAKKWLEKQPAELRNDQLYQQAANSLQWRDSYQEAVDWAGQIQQQDTRESTYREIYNGWKTSDEKKAQEWLSTVDEATRAAILSDVPEPVEATEIAPAPQVVP